MVIQNFKLDQENSNKKPRINNHFRNEPSRGGISDRFWNWKINKYGPILSSILQAQIWFLGISSFEPAGRSGSVCSVLRILGSRFIRSGKIIRISDPMNKSWTEIRASSAFRSGPTVHALYVACPWQTAKNFRDQIKMLLFSVEYSPKKNRPPPSGGKSEIAI